MHSLPAICCVIWRTLPGGWIKSFPIIILRRRRRLSRHRLDEEAIGPKKGAGVFSQLTVSRVVHSSRPFTGVSVGCWAHSYGLKTGLA